MSVWDPEIEIQFKHTGTQSKDSEWISPTYELAPDEVLEIYRMEIIPPVDTTAKVIKKLKYVTLRIEDNEYGTIRINSIMNPLESPDNIGVAVNFGIPYLWRPITGKIPSAIEGTCPKVARGQRFCIKTVADEDITQDYTVVLKCARVRGANKLIEVIGTPLISVTFMLDTDVYTKTIPVSLETFDQLPGGLKQSVPQILPWFTYARNKVATTPNAWYEFDYPNFVKEDWMDLSWNLVNKEVAYLVNAIGVIPHANSKALRLYVDGRITNPEFSITTTKNFFYPAMTYSTDTNALLKRAGPRFLSKSFLFHGVKGGIQIVDNGTSIPADGIEVMIYGTKFVLK